MADIQSTEKSRDLFDRASRVVPGGVNSPVRAFRSVGGDPRFMVSGEGCRMTDADGNTYVDLVGSWGPLILGHAHPHVIDAVTTAAAKGTSFGTPTPGEVALAEELTARTGVEKIRLVNSGTEATMSALRLARAATGRTKIIKFSGCYHGHVDPLLAAAGSGVATLALPDSPGVVGTDETIVVAYNDIDAVAKTFAEYEGQIACVITEAAAGNMGVVAPRDGFNRRLAELCRANGALLILDEVMTGFRVSRNGWAGLELRARATGEDERAQGGNGASVQPRGSSVADVADLFTYGKVMGGGLPAAAFGGRAELMDRLAPSGPVYQAGTLSGNPLACAAGLATLQLCDDALYAKLDAVSQTLGEAAVAALTEVGVPHRLSRAGNMFSVFFTADDVRDFAGAQRQNVAAYRAFFHEMLARGVYLPPSAYEAWFVSGALDDDAVSQITDALPSAARAAAKVAP